MPPRRVIISVPPEWLKFREDPATGKHRRIRTGERPLTAQVDDSDWRKVLQGKRAAEMRK
jgi:hypothetical protein